MAEEKKDLSNKTEVPAADGKKGDWKSVAEVRMLMYIIPMALGILALSAVLSQCTR